MLYIVLLVVALISIVLAIVSIVITARRPIYKIDTNNPPDRLDSKATLK